MPSPLASTHKSQAEYRRNYTNVDEFGRPWAFTVEKETGDPVVIRPCGWDDPLLTPMKYLSVPADNRGLVRINWKLWQDDLTNAHRQWRDRRDKWGRAAFGTAYNPSDPHPDATYQAGDPPLDPEEIAKAQSGDRKLLGLPEADTPAEKVEYTDPVDDRVEQDAEQVFLETHPSWPKFNGYYATRGVKTNEIRLKWADHKEQRGSVAVT